MLTDSLLSGAQALADAGSQGRLDITPPASVAEWPLIGEPLYKFWQEAATNLPKFLSDFTPQLKAFGSWILGTVAGTGLGLLMLIISFVIAGVLLAAAPRGAQAAEAFAIRVAGHRGPEFASLSSLTIRNVALGIVGVSILQSVLLGIGFLAIGLPAAGLLALIVLVLCIVQIGPTVVSLPVIIYVFSTSDTLPAVLFTIWTVVMTFGDGVLKPIVFSRGAVVPTVVIFLGAIGGMIAYGIIGLFVGAVVLSLGYEIYIAWLEETPVDKPGTESSA
jgi:predicted PurR-regulated permease PerM